MHPDRPIESTDEDLFGRSSFIKNLAQEIRNLSSNESVVIGLSGPWGSGKTSVVNLVTKEIRKNRSEDLLARGDVIEVRFSPWNHITNETKNDAYFISAFFDALLEQLEEQAFYKCWKKEDVDDLFDAIDEYVSLLTPGIVKATLRVIIRRKRNNMRRERVTVDSAKKAVLKATSFLRECNIKILVVIDDIDRLPKEYTRLVFQLITAIADFPSVNYLIAYDEEIVSEALTDVQGGSGRKYLDKVIQVPLVMPEASPTAIRAEIIRRFEYVTFLGIRGNEEGDNDFSHIASAVQTCILSMRDVNRLDNALRFKVGVLGEQISPVDLFALEALRIICPEIVEWISQRRLTLCTNASKDRVVKAVTEDSTKDLKCAFEKDFTKKLIDTQAPFRIIELLFISPRKRYADSHILRADVHRRKRVCDSEIFELYLNGDLSTLSDMSDSLLEVIQSGKEQDFSSYIYQAYKKGKYLEAIESLLPVSGSLLTETATEALRAVTKNIKFADRSSISFSENTRTIDLFESLLSPLESRGDTYRTGFIKSIFENSDDTEVVSMAEFIIRQERARERHGFHGSSYSELVSLSHLELIEKRFVNSMVFLFEIGSLVFMENIYAQLALFRQLDEEGFRKMLAKTSTDALCTVLIAEASVGSWHGYGSSGSVSGYYTNDNIHELIDICVIKEMTTSLLSNERFWHMHHDSQVKTAALIMCVERDQFGALGNSLDIDEIESQLERWRKEFFPEDDADDDSQGDSR